MDDVRYSELIFLQKLAKYSPGFEYYNPNYDQPKIIGLHPTAYQEMAATLLEDLLIKFDDQFGQKLVAKLRGELSAEFLCPHEIQSNHWANPREGLYEVLGGRMTVRLRIT